MIDFHAEYPEFDCVDCKVNTFETLEYYMVYDDVWTQAGMSTKSGTGMLCLDCLSHRLSRPLTAADFPADIPVNHIYSVYDKI